MKTPTKLENPALKVNPFVREMKRHWMLYLMALPGLIHVLVFNYFPMIGLGMAFQDLDFDKGLFTSPFVGLKNFKFLFSSTDSWVMTRNTVLYNLVWIALNMFLSVALALIVTELTNKRFSKVSQTIYMMPSFLSMVVVSTITSTLLAQGKDGYINKILGYFGKEPVNWFIQIGAWPFILTFVQAWKSVGYQSVSYTATIAGIGQEYYEAAAIDGASRFQQLIHITVPNLKMILALGLIGSMGTMFRSNFDLFFLIPQNVGTLYPVTMTLDTYIYNALRNFSNMNMSLAAGFYQSVVGFVLVLISNRIVKALDENCSVF